MVWLTLDLDPETHRRLVERAGAERRPVTWQAEVMLRRALGVPVPVLQPCAVCGAEIELHSELARRRRYCSARCRVRASRAARARAGGAGA